uniref:CDK5 regulatory subunit-associated protein 2/Myomegalin coiled coil domain-containing protein n=1 Tax=Nothobranchius furzeri TaxID=105023 RepID=A0A8C6PV93_NOTFU
MQQMLFQLNQYECAAGQCVSELQKAQLQVQSLQAKIQESEANNMKLQEKLTEMECELRLLRQAAQSQDRTIQGLTESISTKDNEVCVIKGENSAPVGMSESLTLAQLQTELVRVQSSLFSVGLELEASQRNLKQSQRQGDDLLRFRDRLNSDLQEALQHREVTEKHNQVSVYTFVQTFLQIYHPVSKPRDVLLEKLRERIKERDKALERSIDDKFSCLEERDSQVRRLQLALREKERDLERLRCILSNNEETILSLDTLVRGKDLELEQAAEAYRNLQWLKQKGEEKDRNALREKDAITNQLQAALQTRSQEVQDLTASLVARVQAGPAEVVEELKARLALKEKLFQELLSDRSCQANEHQAQVQDLLNALTSKDQYLQVDRGGGMNTQLSENESERNTDQFFYSARTTPTEKIQGLHTELDSVQALRGQLEEVLTRTRRTALSLERAAKGQAVSGGGNGQGPASEAAGGTLTIAQRR